MKLSVYADDIAKLSTGILGLLCFEESLAEAAAFQTLDNALGGLLARLASEEQFKGKTGQGLQLHTHGRIGPGRLLLVGAGARKDFNPSELRGFAARVVKAGLGAQLKQAAVLLPSVEGAVQDRAAQFLSEGALLGSYRFDKYLTGDR